MEESKQKGSGSSGLSDQESYEFLKQEAGRQMEKVSGGKKWRKSQSEQDGMDVLIVQVSRSHLKIGVSTN